MVAIVAPRGLTAKSITPALLQDLGLLKPASQGSMSAGGAVSQALALSAQAGVRAFCRGTSPIGGALSQSARGGAASAKSAGVTPTFTHHFSNNWSGYEVTSAEYGNVVNQVNGAWTVNSSHTSTAYQPSIEGSWIGIGGGDGEQSGIWGLVQEGTSMETGHGYRDWYELIGGNRSNGTDCAETNSACDPIYMSNVSPGDVVNGEVYWNSGSQACFIFSDETHTGDSFDTCSGIPSGSVYDHTSGEWINEYPISVNSSGQPTNYYDDPGTTYWSNQSVGAAFGISSSTSAPFSHPYEAFVMLVAGTQFVDDSTPNPACTSTGVMSFPSNPGVNGSAGTSIINTCGTGSKYGEDGN